MNPLTNMKNVLKLSEHELRSGSKSSWHDMYRDSAWIFVGGFPFTLSEGDIVCVFSQYGEVVNINLVRDKATGKSKGFCFLCYEDQRSTILAVDNLNGIKILGRTLRVDHVANYKPPKENDKMDEETLRLYMEGCAPKPQLHDSFIKRESATKDVNILKEEKLLNRGKKCKKSKKHNKQTKKKSKSSRKRRASSSSDTHSSSSSSKNSSCNKHRER